MEVILLNDVEKLGLRGEVVNVARGYARNFLLPRMLAEPATPAKVAELRRRDERRALNEARSADQAHTIAETLAKTVLRFDVKAGPTGSLFGSVTATNIADELWRTRKIRVDRRKIDMDAIKRIGRFRVPIDIFQDVRAEVQTLVVPEGGELPSDEELEAMAAEERGEEAAATAPTEGASELEQVLAAEAAAATEVEPGDEPEPTAREVAAEPQEAADEPEAPATEPAAEAVEDPEAPAAPETTAEPESAAPTPAEEEPEAVE